MSDLVSHILTSLGLRGTLYFRTAFTPPYGVAVPQFRNVARFHFAHAGTCHVVLPGTGEAVDFATGDLLVVPHGAPHNLMSPGPSPEPALELDTVLSASGFTGDGALVWGGGGRGTTELICGHFAFSPGARHPLIDRLPLHFILRDYGAEAGDWLKVTLEVIARSAGSGRPGGDLVAQRLSEAIFAQALSVYLQSDDAQRQRLSGFADRSIARALLAFHEDPAADWSVATLAREAGLSRTVFAERFAQLLGETPMAYAAAWRMQLAHAALAEERVSVIEAAARAGYASEAAFSRSFKRAFGVPPSTVSRRH